MRLRPRLSPIAMSTLFSGDDYAANVLAYNPTAFYDVEASQLWQDSARTTVAGADADVVGAWDDLSGNDHHIIQATTANKPTLRLNVLNSRPIIRFDGTDDSLQDAAFPDFGDNYTAFFVATFSSDGIGDGSQGVFDVSNGAATKGFKFYHAGAIFYVVRDAAATKTVFGGNSRDGVARLNSMHNTSTEIELWTNGVSEGTKAYTSPNPNTLDQLDVGRNIAASWFFWGDLSTLIIFNRTLTDAERDSVVTILNNQYGVF